MYIHMSEHMQCVREAEYNKLINEEQGKEVEPRKNKLLIQALDISGSMGGQPLDCLKAACLQLGERFYGQEKSDFEKLITITFDH